MKFRVAAVAVAALALVPASAAVAAPKPAGPQTLADGLVGPLHLSVGPGKVVTVSEEFAGMLTNVSRGGAKTPAYTTSEADGWDVAGTDYQGSSLYVLQSKGAGPEDPRPLEGQLLRITGKGTVSVVTDQIGAYEVANNPDHVNTYGLSAADAAAYPACVSWIVEQGADPASISYTGEVDSHPYAVKVVGNTAYVADAGMNAVLAVNLHSGAIRTLAVLPPRPITFPGGPCAGLTYTFEPVPTDVEMGPDGMLYVSSLPGGPEDDSLGARGGVFKINPATGATTLDVEGVMSPTGIALDGAGNLYIASLFGPGILKVPAGSHTASIFIPTGLAADVEVSGSTLYATVNALPGESGPPNGMLISQRL